MMEVLFNILALNIIISPVFSYVYDEPRAGYVDMGNYGLNPQRKYYSSLMKPSNQRYKDRTMDSHFRVMKSSPYSYPVSDAQDKSNNNDPDMNTEEPPQRKVDDEVPESHRRRHDPRNVRYNTKDAKWMKAEREDFQREQVNRPDRDSPHQSQRKIQGNRDNNRSFVEVRKTQIPTDPQVISRYDKNRQLTALTVNHPVNYHQRMQTAVIVDKNLHKATKFNERNAHAMSRILDDMTQKLSDRRQFKGDYRKRETFYGQDEEDESVEKFKRHTNVFDTMKKYIGKDKNMIKEGPRKLEPARIGVLDEMEVNDTPYALFYRMVPEHLESLEQQESFIVMGEDISKDAFNNKQKRLSVNFEKEVDLKKTKSKKNANTVKLHKKVKNFSNFQNL